MEDEGEEEEEEEVVEDEGEGEEEDRVGGKRGDGAEEGEEICRGEGNEGRNADSDADGDSDEVRRVGVSLGGARDGGCGAVGVSNEGHSE